jgi:hypothetical protein
LKLHQSHIPGPIELIENPLLPIITLQNKTKAKNLGLNYAALWREAGKKHPVTIQFK